MGLDMYIKELKLTDNLSIKDIKKYNSNKLSKRKIKSIILNSFTFEEKKSIMKKKYNHLLDLYIQYVTSNGISSHDGYGSNLTISEAKNHLKSIKNILMVIDNLTSDNINSSKVMSTFFDDFDIISEAIYRYSFDNYNDFINVLFTESTEFKYWRKANAIHSYIVEHLQDNVDDCDIYIITEEFLTQFKEDLETVLSDNSKSEELIPTQSGFFFGSVDYDEYYYEEIQSTLDCVNDILNNFDDKIKDGYVYTYQSSW